MSGKRSADSSSDDVSETQEHWIERNRLRQRAIIDKARPLLEAAVRAFETSLGEIEALLQPEVIGRDAGQERVDPDEPPLTLDEMIQQQRTEDRFSSDALPDAHATTDRFIELAAALAMDDEEVVELLVAKHRTNEQGLDDEPDFPCFKLHFRKPLD